jgi:hypothetical protein
MRFCCLVIALAFLAIFASDSWGQSKQPSSKVGQQNAAQQERGTENSPVVVKVIPTEKSKDDLAREDAKDKDKLAVDNRIASLTGELAFYTKLLFVATALLALITAGLVIASFRQVRDAREAIAAAVKSANAAVISADAAKLNALAIINAERAHLYVVIKRHDVSDFISAVAGFKFSEAIAKDPMNPPTLSYVFKNYGKTPATIEDIAHCVSINETEGGPRTYDTPERALEILGMGDETEPIFVRFGERQFIAEDAKALGDHSMMLFFYSRATFLDAFNRKHIIDSDFLYSAGRFHMISRRETSEQIQEDSQPERPPKVGFFGRP